MNWDDPNSPWAKAMRRRMRLTVGGLALLCMCGVLLVYSVIQLHHAMRQAPPGMTPTLPVLVLFPFLPLIAALVVLSRKFWRLRKLAHDLPLANGRICPLCRRRLQYNGNDGLNCEHCSRAWEPDTIFNYWQQVAMDPVAARYWLASRRKNRASNPRRSLGQFKQTVAEKPVAMLVIFAGLWVLVTIGAWRFTSTTLLDSALMYFPMLCVASGVMLLGVGQIRRKGAERRCAVCDYRQSPVGEPLKRCPECGADWTRAGALVQGAPIRTTRHKAVGICFIGLGLLFLFSPLSDARFKSRILPTGMLINQITSDRFALAEWNELNTRPLTREQQLALAEGLLDQRLREDYLSQEGRKWMEARIKGGTLPNELVDRYYAESVALFMDGPAQAPAGETVRVVIKAIDRIGYLSNAALGMYVYVGDYAVNGKRLAESRRDEMLEADSLDGAPRGRAIEVIAADTVRVEVDVWLVVQPRRFSRDRRITWNADGTPVLPDDAVWSEKVTLEHVIEVADE